jgi:hypothetical protein
MLATFTFTTTSIVCVDTPCKSSILIAPKLAFVVHTQAEFRRRRRPPTATRYLAPALDKGEGAAAITIAQQTKAA